MVIYSMGKSYIEYGMGENCAKVCNRTTSITMAASLIPFGICPGLERMEYMLDQFEHPERRLKFIHIAGTNGKGSTASFLMNAYRKAGYETGAFVSPELNHFNDRIQMNGEPIPDEVLLDLCNRLKPVVDACVDSKWGSPTEFEVTTMLAILYFAKVSFPDIVTWETGLGGRLDSTNVVIPICSVITNIGMDHMDILGEHLLDIAREKAGIIKPGVPIISGCDQPEVIQLLKQFCAEKKSSLYQKNEHFYVSSIQDGDVQTFLFNGPFRSYENVQISMQGEHQISNAALALMTLEILRNYMALIVEPDHIYAAFRETTWPGRYEVLGEREHIILDGAHNPEGAKALRQLLLKKNIANPLTFIIGLSANKK